MLQSINKMLIQPDINNALHRCLKPLYCPKIFKLITVLYILYSIKIPAVHLNINDVGTAV